MIRFRKIPVGAWALAALLAAALPAPSSGAHQDDAAPKAQEAPPPARPAPPVPPEDPSWGEQLLGIPVHGSLSSRFRARRTSGDHDTDFYETLSLSVGNPDRHLVTAFVLARLAADLDGRADEDEYFVFDSLQDTYEKAVTAQLYEAWLDVHRLGPVERVRLGRQTLYETPVAAFFDGARAETGDLTDLKFRLGAYGGLPVHLYEPSPEGDRLGGAFAQVRPWAGARLRADWMHVDDENLLGENNDDLWGFAAWQDLLDRFQVHALYTRLEEHNRDILVRGMYRGGEEDLVVQASFYELFRTQRQYSIEFDPFYNSLLEYHPYREARALISKGFGKTFTVDAGADARWLRDSDNEGPLNHEFQRYFVTPSVRDVLAEGLSLSLSGEFWNSDEDVWSWGADVTWRLNDAWKASAGTAYSLYKYDYYTGRERDDVRTVYIRLRWKLGKDLRLDGGYEHERGDPDTIQTVKLGLTWEF